MKSNIKNLFTASLLHFSAIALTGCSAGGNNMVGDDELNNPNPVAKPIVIVPDVKAKEDSYVSDEEDSIEYNIDIDTDDEYRDTSFANDGFVKAMQNASIIEDQGDICGLNEEDSDDAESICVIDKEDSCVIDKEDSIEFGS